LLSSIKDNKQKASVEGTVGKIATAIIATLRKKTFYSLENISRGRIKGMVLAIYYALIIML